jgi:hypothetical protein
MDVANVLLRAMNGSAVAAKAEAPVEVPDPS